jgi:hypothetical protein
MKSVGAMGEQPEWLRHRIEAERFQRLSGMSPDPKVKVRLAEIARYHERIADRLRALSNGMAHRLMDRQGSSSAKQPRHVYRLHLLRHGGSDLTLSIEAASDGEALRIAWLLQDACAECYENFELRQHERCIAKSWDRRTAQRPANLNEITSSVQAVALQLEETLLSSRLAVAESRKLLKATAELRSMAVKKP